MPDLPTTGDPTTSGGYGDGPLLDGDALGEPSMVAALRIWACEGEATDMGPWYCTRGDPACAAVLRGSLYGRFDMIWGSWLDVELLDDVSEEERGGWNAGSLDTGSDFGGGGGGASAPAPAEGLFWPGGKPMESSPATNEACLSSECGGLGRGG